jgi:hypothetical protein
MAFDLAPFGPDVGDVVVVDAAQQQARCGLVDDEPDVSTDPYRPEVRVFGPIQLVELHARMGRIQLQIEGGGLDRLLLLARKSVQAIMRNSTVRLPLAHGSSSTQRSASGS